MDDESHRLKSAIWNHDIDLLNTLIASPTFDIELRDPSGWTMLHYACSYGFAKGVLALLEAGADINTKTIVLQWTPLRVACTENRLNCIEALIFNGAILDELDEYCNSLSLSSGIRNFLYSLKGGRATKAAAI